MIKMEKVCDHLINDSDDDILLLDDNNTENKECLNCIKQGTPHTRICMTGNGGCTNVIHLDDNLDEPEDSPLLINERISDFGHLSIKDFHCHSYNVPQDDSKAYWTLWIVSLLCFLFMVTEIIGGHIAGSLAVMTDAAHLFSDLISFMVSIISIWIGRKKPTQYMTFGYYRVEVMGAFLSVLAVWLLAGVFCVLAIGRMIKKEYDINADTMLVVAGLGLIVNIVMGSVLHGFCSNHTHSHGGLSSHSHNDNINIRAAAAHVIGDLLQSIGVLLAAVLIKIFPEAKIADPICTVLFSVIVVGATIKVAKDSVLLLIESSPKNSNEIYIALKSIIGVKHVHSLKYWSLAPGKEAIAVHLAVDVYCDRDTVLNQATHLIKYKLNVISCTIQIEHYDQEQTSLCSECQILQC